MGRRRIDDLFAGARAANRAVFLPFMTAGLPDPATSPKLFSAMATAGADGFEVGIPYSDPLMDGPIIQRASDTALRAGAGFDASIDVLAKVVEETQVPSLVMTYANPVFRRGIDAFCARLEAVGADGIIVPDLPVEEAGPLRQAAERHGLGLVLFVAPTSDKKRIEAVAAADPAFIYAVAEMGVTGERRESSGRAGEVVENIRAVTEAPIVFGVGISNAEQARAAADAGADGVIVGSALVHLVLDASSEDAAISALSSRVSEIAAALAQAR